uniref:Uncharacterized protein n=2 Tax=Meloidogyne TaxID=189290 RepID=A0A6V7V7S5_MELEN|nr:unnamed protein product [Meloidogyne enterolobii]
MVTTTTINSIFIKFLLIFLLGIFLFINLNKASPHHHHHSSSSSEEWRHRGHYGYGHYGSPLRSSWPWGRR